MEGSNDKYARRKVDADEATNAMIERSIDSSAYQARSEADRRDFYPVGRDSSSKAKRAERDIDSVGHIGRAQGRKSDWETYVKKNTR